MSHFEKLASVLAFSIAAALAATGCAAPSGDDDVDDEDYIVEATPQGGFQETFQKGGFQKGFQKGFSKSAKGAGYFSKVPAQAPSVGYGQQYDQSQQTGQAQPYGQTQPFGQVQPYGQAQSFGQAQPYGQAQ